MISVILPVERRGDIPVRKGRAITILVNILKCGVVWSTRVILISLISVVGCR